MAIITISRGCYSHGKELAEMVAGELGYECVSREVLIDASNLFQVPERELFKSLHDAPSILKRLQYDREYYFDCIQAALLDRAKDDNVVYHGNAGHFMLPDILHVFKVRVVADMDQRIAFMMSKEGITQSQAAERIEREDSERRRWTQYLYKRDLQDPLLYDLVVNVGKMTLEEACDLICYISRLDTYRTTEESRRKIAELALASLVKAAVRPVCKAEVKVCEGVAYVKVRSRKIHKSSYAAPKVDTAVCEQIREDIVDRVQEAVKKVPGLSEVVVCDVDLPPC
jgi:cytidylate kinase